MPMLFLFIYISNLEITHLPHRGILGNVQVKFKNIKTKYFIRRRRQLKFKRQGEDLLISYHEVSSPPFKIRQKLILTHVRREKRRINDGMW